jgi:cellobiose phosphorylase
MLRGAIERICGIRADYDGLIIDPQLPDAWNKCSIIRNFRNRQFHIEITRKLIADELHKYDIYVDGSKIKQPGETKIFLNNNESI